MRWKRVTCAKDTLCAARGCPIPPGERHWQARWKDEAGKLLEAHYCCECGAGSQAHPGDTLYGLCGTLGLLGLFLVALLVWPQQWRLWIALFAVMYASAAGISTLLFLRIYPDWRGKEPAPPPTVDKPKRAAAA